MLIIQWNLTEIIHKHILLYESLVSLAMVTGQSRLYSGSLSGAHAAQSPELPPSDD